MTFKVRVIYHNKEIDDDQEIEYQWSAIPRIGESIMIDEYAYKIIDIIWENEIGGPLITIYTS
jgi:hypothetical protein